jgi:hypothetical protein
MRIGFANIHRAPPPGLMAVMRRGMGSIGQTGCPGSLEDALQSWLSSLSAELPVDAAVGCGTSGGAPCGSPSEASQMAVTIAQQFCDLASSVAGQFPGCSVDPACSDPASAAAPYAAQALSLFNSFPASVWSTEVANAASGDYYGAIGTEQGPAPNVGCGPGQNGLYLATVNGSVVSIPCGTAAPVSTSANAPASSTPATVTSPGTATTTPAGTASSSSSSSSSGGSSTGSTLTDSLGWFTESSFDGIPNWALLAAGIAALVFVVPMLTGRRG